MKKVDILKDYREKCERERVICWLIVTAFEQKAQYDYLIPTPWIIKDMIKSIFADNEYPEEFCKEIIEIVNFPRSCDPYSDYDPSTLASFMTNRNNIFREETLFQMGSWYAWRNEKDCVNSKKENEAKLSKTDLACMKKLQKHLREKASKLIKQKEEARR